MTTKQPASGNGPAVSRRAMLAAIPATAALPAAAMAPVPGRLDPSTEQTGTPHAERRIRQFCEWFDLEMPALEYEDGGILLTEELGKWFASSGASLDWVICGDAKGMAASFRKEWLEEQRLFEVFHQFDATERSIIEEALERRRKGLCTIDDAIDRVTAAIEAYRGEGVAA